MEFILNQLVYFGFLQSLFLLGLYAFSSKVRQQLSGYLIFLVLILMIGLLGRVLNISELFGANRRLITVSEFANLLFGATVYLFTRSSLFNKPFSGKELIHYLPALIYSTGIFFLFILPSDEAIRVRIQGDRLYAYVFSFIGFALAFNISYYLASVRLFLRFRAKLQNEMSVVIKSTFFRNFLVAIGLCIASWTTIYLISLFGFRQLEIQLRSYIWVSIALIIFFLTYYTRREPELFKLMKRIPVPKYLHSKLNREDLDRLKEKLDQLMEEKKPYLNRNLMKADLAEMLGVNSPEVARLLNERIGMNFFEYVNYFRIKEFIELAKTDRAKTLTFFGLAQEAGFNSKTTFNKSFKKIIGTSPSEYFEKEMG